MTVGKRGLLHVDRAWLQASILFLFFFPLFFQLSGKIFREEGYFRSEGKLLELPLPIASIACFVGIALLLRIERRHFGMGFLFAFFICMMLAVVFSTVNSENIKLARFILLIQFILPVFALVLGRLYVRPKSDHLRFEAILLYVLILIIPLEVVATVIQGDVHLASYLYAFSLYQHLQYMPVLFVGFYILIIGTFLEDSRFRPWLMFLSAWMGAYLAASLAMSAILLMVIGLSMFLARYIRRGDRSSAFVVVALVVLSFSAYFHMTQQASYYSFKFGADLELSNGSLAEYLEYKESVSDYLEGTFVGYLPRNLKERVIYWRIFGEGVLESTDSLLFGHAARPDRRIFPSAHNYYLNLLYNFGLISLLPIGGLLVVTVFYSRRAISSGQVDGNLAVLMLLVGFFALVDNSLKVGFRQPYPGMMMFFVWGVLLTRLDEVVRDTRKFATE